MNQVATGAAPGKGGAATVPPTHLSVRGITKSFAHFKALDRIDLDVKRGELVCFLGPSGCGKTTLLRAIAGLDPQDEGRIEIGGRDVSGLPPSERDFGIVFQSYALFPNLTVADNVGYGLVNRRKSRDAIKARVDELLALVGLSDQRAKYPVQLSGGQQQRVALARALATSPSLLLLDEPLSALDARVRHKLRGEIKDLQRRLGITTVMVTHDQEEALAMADRIVVMNHGRIEQIGTPVEIYTAPATPFVADFIGAMTLLEGEVAGGGTVRIGNVRLTCPPAQTMPAGSKVRLGIRPEDVRVRGLGSDTPNRVMVKVNELEFLGAFCRARLEPEGFQGQAIIADFSANAVRDLAIATGKQLTIALPPESLRAFA